ncbi:MAG: polysaccharide lyase family 7 protein [Spirosomataceae bacterium]
MLPSSILNLTNWKITIPFDANGKDGNESSVAAETNQPELQTYTLSGYYFVNNTNDGVVFKAHAGGAHTSGSGFPRCELREMIENGSKTAKWQSNSGKHTMEIDQAITFLPSHKKHVVAGQIHSTGDFDDVITCRLEDKKLFLSHNGAKGTMLTDNYVLGTRFKIKFVVENNEIKSYYNNAMVETYRLAFPDAYFKAGCYTQSASWGKNDNHQADASDYGEVVIYGLSVAHE